MPRSHSELQAFSKSLDRGNFSSGFGTESYVASVPSTTHDVQLQMTDEGFDQSLSLWTLRRTIHGPSVLYDGQSGSKVTEQFAISKEIQIARGIWPLLSRGRHGDRRLVDGLQSTERHASAQRPCLSRAVHERGLRRDGVRRELPNFSANITPIPPAAVSFTSGRGIRYVAERSPSDGSWGSRRLGALQRRRAVGCHLCLLGPASTGDRHRFDRAGGDLRASLHGLRRGHGGAARDRRPRAILGTFPKPPAPTVQPTPPWVGEPNPPTGVPDTSTSSSGLPIGVAVAVLALVVGAILLVRRKLGSTPEEEPAEPDVAPRRRVVAPVGSPTPKPLLHVDFLGPVSVIPAHSWLTEF